jgi:lipopolysaccharide export system protein LptC
MHFQPKNDDLIPRSTKPASVLRTTLQIARNDRRRAFRAASRHTRLVRFLRYAIPTAIAAIALVIFVASYLSSLHLFPAFPIDIGRVSFSGTRITMELPRINRYTIDARPYQLTARAAEQDVTKPDILELKELRAETDLKDGQHVTVKSINGIYDSKSEILKLRDHIVLTSTSGLEGHFSEATIDVTTSNIVSESPVEIKLPNDGLLNANRMRVEQNGDLIVFSGDVEVTLKPEQLRPSGETPSSNVPSTEVSVQQPMVQPLRPEIIAPDLRN